MTTHDCTCRHDLGHHQGTYPHWCSVCSCRKYIAADPPARSCITHAGISKRTYHAKATAKKAAKRMGHGVAAYRCPICDWWHVGHNHRKAA